MEEELRAAFAAGELAGLHSVLLLIDGQVEAEVHFPGADEAWGPPVDRSNPGPDTLHDLRSVSKSVVGLLYGIAMDHDHVPPPEAPLYPLFPEYADLAEDPDRQAITVQHLLTMSMGIEWNEDLPYSDPNNSEIAMELAEDRYRYVLSRPVIEPPGQRWHYCGGATALLARLIEKGSGQTIAAFARQHLFAPLGITSWHWAQGADGVHAAASGLRLTARDLARIGELVLANGIAGDLQVVPEGWIEECLTPQLSLGELDYGYQWYIAPNWVAGFGNGGQRLSVNAAENLVLVVFAGNYNAPDAWELPVKVATDFVTPLVAARRR
ncbi:serine hydrolase domain-containing protein [Pseudooceanicola sp. LIPI14-2-Ac024]|uniref:serine hydrolase domain-containing protein n=1 Tax=Pseudooceanicola sp. LIPI14-2-Ac024 TaxID=3344875 RepID=UPI0035CFFCD8